MGGDDSAWFHAGHAVREGKPLCPGGKQACRRVAGQMSRYLVSGTIRHRMAVRDGKGVVR